MEGPRPGGSALLITDSPVPGKYDFLALITPLTAHLSVIFRCFIRYKINPSCAESPVYERQTELLLHLGNYDIDVKFNTKHTVINICNEITMQTVAPPSGNL